MDAEMVELLKRMIRMDAERNDLGLMERDLEACITDGELLYRKLIDTDTI